MKPALIAAASTAVLAVGAACSDSDWEHTPASGTITYLEYEYEAAETETDCGYDYEYDPISGKYKNVYGCDTYYEPEYKCWLVEFETPAGDVYEDCTTEAMWNQLKIGMVYTEGQPELATHTPWLTPSPSVSPSASATVAPSATASAG